MRHLPQFPVHGVVVTATLQARVTRKQACPCPRGEEEVNEDEHEQHACVVVVTATLCAIAMLQRACLEKSCPVMIMMRSKVTQMTSTSKLEVLVKKHDETARCQSRVHQTGVLSGFVFQRRSPGDTTLANILDPVSE